MSIGGPLSSLLTSKSCPFIVSYNFRLQLGVTRVLQPREFRNLSQDEAGGKFRKLVSTFVFGSLPFASCHTENTPSFIPFSL